jgi:hypothetical protein
MGEEKEGDRSVVFSDIIISSDLIAFLVDE